MPAENLTRQEAIARKAVVDVSHYEISLDVTQGERTFRSTTTIVFHGTAGASTFVDAITEQVHSVTLNGESLDVASVSDGTRIQLPQLQAHNVLVVDADMRYTNTGEGLHRFVDPVDHEVYLYSQFEVPDARRVYAVFEQPDLKATFQFTVIAPAAWQVLSNAPTPTPTDLGDGTAIWHFEPSRQMSNYITAIIAGPYAVTRSELTSSDGRVIPLGVFARQSLAEHVDADYIFDITRRGFAYYESKFGVPYAFDKYDQIFVPEFNAGAMENAGAVTFTEVYVFRSKVTDAIKERRVVTILHELAHMWFGDLVTMKWWNDLWLNESFAEWASTLATAEATEWHEAWTTFAASGKSWAYRQDQLPSTHPIVAEIRDLEDVLVNFDGITYAKGASVLKQLVAWVGIEPFFAGVGNYFRTHAWSNTELPDLLTELEAASGRDLSSWSKLWLETAGVNTLRPELEVAADGTISSFAVLQTAAADYPTLRPHRLAIGLYELVDGGLERVQQLELDVDGARTEVPELVGTRRPALILLNDDDLAYAKIRLDEVSQHSAIEHLASIRNPLARTLVWGSMWDALRDAEIPARDFLALVLGNIATETESTTLRIVLSQAQTAANTFSAPAERAQMVQGLADGIWQLARAAAPGGDAQFQFVKSFAALAEHSSHVDELAQLFAGEISLEGLEIDTDLGWELLIALAAAGRADEGEIAAYLATDNTADGAQFAAQARAARPSAAVKQAAWDSLVATSEAPNEVVRTTAAGFVRGSDELLTPFIAPYFDMLERIWDERSYAIAERIIEGLYPMGLANEALRVASQGWLDAHTDAPPALRRLIIENLASVERALTAQACDRAAASRA